MKIAFSYDPNLVVDLENKDIIFDLASRAIYARGVKYSTESIAKYRPIYINGILALENNNTALNLVAGNNILLTSEKDDNNKYTGKVVISSSITDITGNSATTTKLQTARNIWGLSFDGTADINGDINIDASENKDRFITFDTGKIPYSWRIGYLGSGTGNTNYLVFLSGKDSGDAWHTALKFGLVDLNATFAGQVIATTFAGNIDGQYVNKLTNYTIATTAEDLVDTDTLNSALGKLEYKTNSTYNWYKSIVGEDTDEIVNKWEEIVDFIDSVAEGTDITDEFVTRKTALTITGTKTFSNDIVGNITGSSRFIENDSTKNTNKHSLQIWGGGIDYGDEIDKWNSPYGNYTTPTEVKVDYGTALRLRYHSNYYHDLWFDANLSSILYRKITNNVSSGWITILDNKNYTTHLNNTYVKKAGDTITGQLGFSGSTYPHIYGNGTYLILGHDNQTNYGLVLSAGVIRGHHNNTQTLGANNNRWSNVYSVDGNFSGQVSFSGSSYTHIRGDANSKLTLGGAAATQLVLDGTANVIRSSSTPQTLGISSVRWSNVYSVLGNFSGQITSSVATGTAPFVITSTTKVANLNADLLDGVDIKKIIHYNGDDGNTENLMGNRIIRVAGNLETDNDIYPYGDILQWSGRGHSYSPSTENAGNFYHQLYSTTTGGLYYRSKISSNAWKAWKTIAFTDSDITGNAATATYATSAGNADNATKWGGYKYYNEANDGANTMPYFKLVTIRIKGSYANDVVSFDISGRGKGVAHIEVYPTNQSPISNNGVARIEITGNSLFADKIRAYTIGNETDSSGNIIAKVIEVWYTKRQQSYDRVVVQNVHFGRNMSVEINCNIYDSLPTSYESYVDATMGSIYGSITKLTTARTLWGQSFDGSANISGGLYGVGSVQIKNAYSLYWADTNDTYLNQIGLNENNLFILGYGSAGKGYRTQIFGNDLVLTVSSARNLGMHLDSSTLKPMIASAGQLDLGSSTARWKDIYGKTLNLTGNISLSNFQHIYAALSDGSNYVDLMHLHNSNSLLIGQGVAKEGHSTNIYGNTISLCYGTAGSISNTALFVNSDGKVGIGTTSPFYKLDVNGTFRATGNTAIVGTLNVAGKFTSDTANLNKLYFIQSTTGTAEGICFVNNWDDGVADDNDVKRPWYGITIDRTSTDYNQLMISNFFGMTFRTGDITRPFVFKGGHVRPYANNSQYLGTSDYRWNTVYTSTLNASGNTTVGGSLGVTGVSTFGNDILYNSGDATLKIYDIDVDANDFGNEAVAIQTCFDNKDPETHDFVTEYEYRCNLLLQPRGGQVYVGYTPTSYQWNYALNVGQAVRLYGDANLTNAPEILFYRDGKSSWKIINDGGGLYFQNNYTTAVQSSYFNVLALSLNTGDASLKGSLDVTSVFSKGAFFSARKRAWNDGVTGSYLGSGTVGICAPNPTVQFFYNNSTAITSQIREISGGVLSVNNVKHQNGNVLPSADGVGNLGSASAKWNNAYVNTVNSDSFIKTDSSNDYILLGGGGHKAISDFLLKSELANLELNNNLTVIEKELTVTQDWMDTGIAYNNLPSNGTYIVLVYVHAPSSSIYECYWSGVMTWHITSSTNNRTNDVESDEIILHRSGHAYDNTIYLRTKMTTLTSFGGTSEGLKLLIAANQTLSAAYTFTFKFKRII